MCGIYAVIACEDNPAPGLFGDVAGLLETSMDKRGRDSWGYAACVDNRVSVARGLGSIVPPGGEIRAPIYADAVVGHTRHATRGAVTIGNAHPYEYGATIGVHNGQIYNAPPSYAVDSMQLIERIADRSTVSDLEGYGAALWLEDGYVHLSRMRGGSLQVARVTCRTTGRAVLAVASHVRSLDAFRSDHTRVRRWGPLPEGRVYWVDPGSLRLVREVGYELHLKHRPNAPTWRSYGGFKGLALHPTIGGK